ncbi:MULTISPECIES: hypothetical protein [Myxococcus]|uniref:hypothetical protein n=1 Tax=Myxococcus TaxID=32 RepID=UPI00036F6979|nr:MULTISPECIES: hypothetical protein [Myxococcus]NOJ54345.1 hypothetical protein [Myxococcus xanthus]QPM78535.1 hypothetical protein I5Q59_30325 [Myxococcus xanthus]QVW67603.1 hypothetical protein JTM82_35675 [Myxococcus xanthus DZ2]QZZ53775.1 hypothetical protein MyxoNM_31595 [Myxococcus xanthus]UEO06270.1 hypothetical protein K1515_07115 [Myxococcus xanthus DZ2]
MNFNPIQGISKDLEQVYRTLSKRHLYVLDACPAEMNGEHGYLGVSSGLYTRVWFDTTEDSKTLFSSFDKRTAREKFHQLRKLYGR